MKLYVQRQLTAALENTPGRLAAICELLSEHRINIEALCVVDNVEQGVTRLVTSDPALTRQVLQDQGIFTIEADVLTIELTDQRGKLATISGRLAESKVNIDYLYGSFHHLGAKTRIVMKVSDLNKAQAALADLHIA